MFKPSTLDVNFTIQPAEIEYSGTAKVRITPGIKGVRYTRNGDGWPDEPAEVEVLDVTLSGAVLWIDGIDDGYELKPHDEHCWKGIERTLPEQLQDDDTFIEKCFEEADEADEAARCEAADMAYERERMGE